MGLLRDTNAQFTPLLTLPPPPPHASPTPIPIPLQPTCCWCSKHTMGMELYSYILQVHQFHWRSSLWWTELISFDIQLQMNRPQFQCHTQITSNPHPAISFLGSRTISHLIMGPHEHSELRESVPNYQSSTAMSQSESESCLFFFLSRSSKYDLHTLNFDSG